MNEELLAWLRTIDDPAALARSLVESGLDGNPDPCIVALARRARGSGDLYRERLLASYPPPKRTLAQLRQQQRFERINGKPARSPQAVLEDLPSTEHIEHPPTGRLMNPPIEGGSTEFVVLASDRRFGAPALEHRVSVQPDRPDNPFTRVPETRSGVLPMKDAIKLYDAVAFGMWKYGAVMNVHITIRWSALHIQEREAPKLLGRYLNQAVKWAANGKPHDCRQRRLEEMRQGHDLLWLYVHEKALSYGFHTHILMSMNRDVADSFQTWSWCRLAQLAGRDALPSDAIRFRKEYAQTLDRRINASWRWYRYLIKQLDPDSKIRLKNSLDEVNARDVLFPWHFRESPAMECNQLARSCNKLGPQAQRAAGFVSRLRAQEFHDIFNAEGMVRFELPDALGP